MAIEIIGWGDTPTRSQFAVSNQEVLTMAVESIERHISTTKTPDPKWLDELKKLQGRKADEVTEKIGVVSRQYATDKTSADLAIEAATRAVLSARKNDVTFEPDKIRLVISGGSTPDDLYPACAGLIQNSLQINEAEGFDVSLACCSGTQAVITAFRAMTADPNICYALVAVGETIGSMHQRSRAPLTEDVTLWGDGGGAVVLRQRGSSERGIEKFTSRIDGSLAYTTRSKGIGAHADHHQHKTFNHLCASMEGHQREIQRWVIGAVGSDLERFVRCNLSPGDLSKTFALFHNGNLKMINSLAEKVGIAPERLLHRIPDRANQSSASVLSSLAYHANIGTFRSGDVLLFATFGGGVAYNFLTYRW